MIAFSLSTFDTKISFFFSLLCIWTRCKNFNIERLHVISWINSQYKNMRDLYENLWIFRLYFPTQCKQNNSSIFTTKHLSSEKKSCQTSMYIHYILCKYIHFFFFVRKSVQEVATVDKNVEIIIGVINVVKMKVKVYQKQK